MAWTYQSLIDDGMTVTAYCHNRACYHRGTLDLERMRDKLGPDAPAMRDDILAKIRCSKCGGTDVGLINSSATSGAIELVFTYHSLVITRALNHIRNTRRKIDTIWKRPLAGGAASR